MATVTNGILQMPASVMRPELLARTRKCYDVFKKPFGRGHCYRIARSAAHPRNPERVESSYWLSQWLHEMSTQERGFNAYEREQYAIFKRFHDQQYDIGQFAKPEPLRVNKPPKHPLPKPRVFRVKWTDPAGITWETKRDRDSLVRLVREFEGGTLKIEMEE